MPLAISCKVQVSEQQRTDLLSLHNEEFLISNTTGASSGGSLELKPYTTSWTCAWMLAIAHESLCALSSERLLIPTVYYTQSNLLQA